MAPAWEMCASVPKDGVAPPVQQRLPARMGAVTVAHVMMALVYVRLGSLEQLVQIRLVQITASVMEVVTMVSVDVKLDGQEANATFT